MRAVNLKSHSWLLMPLTRPACFTSAFNSALQKPHKQYGKGVILKLDWKKWSCSFRTKCTYKKNSNWKAHVVPESNQRPRKRSETRKDVKNVKLNVLIWTENGEIWNYKTAFFWPALCFFPLRQLQRAQTAGCLVPTGKAPSLLIRPARQIRPH